MSELDDQNGFSTTCRLCLSQNVELLHLYPNDEFDSTASSNKIVQIIERFTTIKIHPWDHLPQKICECCLETIKSMQTFQNKCKRNNEELQKKIRDRVDSKDDIEILDTSDTKQIFEVVDVDGTDTKEFLDLPDVNKTGTKEVVVHLDGSDTKEIFEVVDIDDDKNDTKEISAMHEDDQDFSIESDEGSINNENLTKHTQKPPNPWKQSDRYPKSRLAGTLACHICGKRYHNYKLQYHINMHEGLRPFACNIDDCTSTFAAPYELKTHKRECHFRVAQWICDVCGRAFKRKPALRVHLSYHFDPQIPCTICEKLFKNNRALTKHMLVHSQERKFKCEICGKLYQTRYTLRIHKRVHTQEKPYSCYCGVSFAYKCLLKSHTEKHHKGKGKPS